MKFSDLSPNEINAWVERAEGGDPSKWGMVPRDAWYCQRWELAGPIIEREKIGVECPRGTQWHASIWLASGRFAGGIGNTPIEAAMMAYVVKEFGDVVPDLGDTT